MSLTSSLSIASQSLMAADGAIQVVNNNIANASTPGYTQESVKLSEGPTFQSSGGVSTGSGVVFTGYQSVRSELLQSQLEQQTQAQSSANAQSTSLSQVEQLFTTSTSDIGTEMSTLFSSVSALSTDPSSTTQRQAVLAAAQGLAQAFNNTSTQMTSIQTGLNAQMSQDVGEINQLSQQIAALNPQIASANQQGQDAGTLQDQQDQLVLQLSQLTNVSVTRTTNGITVNAGNAAIVVGSKSFALNASIGSSGTTVVQDSQGTDVTSSLTGGDLGGAQVIQNKTIPALQQQLDTLASQVGQAFNTAQGKGYDLNGKAGANLFSLPSGTAGAAASIAVSATSPASIAASSDGSSGSNGNLANFAAIQNGALPSGATPGNTYANLVYQVGQLAANVKAASSAAQSSTLQLKNQISSVSGVSIDQETTSLIQFQQAYQAAAKVVSVIQSLFQVTMSMVG